MEEKRQKVLITGITGFVGSHLCKTFLEDDSFQIRGTVRNNSEKQEKLNSLKNAFGKAFDEVEIVEADLSDLQSLDKAVQGCDIVIHSAHPYPSEQIQNKDDLIKLVLNGLNAILNAIVKYKIKKFILTSTYENVYGQSNVSKLKIDEPFLATLNDWQHHPYQLSKLILEFELTKFWISLPLKGRFDLVVMLPGHILGPSITGRDHTSNDIIKQLLSGNMRVLPKLKLPFVDVRDVAKAHLNACKYSGKLNLRIILVSETLWLKDIAEYLNHQFKYEYMISLSEMSYGSFYLKSFFNKKYVRLLPFIEQDINLNNERSIELFQIKYQRVYDSVIDTAFKLIEEGKVKNQLKPRL